MKKRELRQSQYNDYLAVDMVEDNNIIETPFYIRKGETKTVLYYDAEDGGWINAKITFDGSDKLKAKGPDGFEWESEFWELLDAKVIRFNIQ